MKFISVSLLVTVAGLAITAVSCNAQNPLKVLDNPIGVAQTAPPRGNPFEQMGLTSEQQSKIQQIRENSRDQIEQILTSEQLAEWRRAMQNRRDHRNTITALNLTPEQQQKLQALRSSEQQQIFEVLTPEQREQFRQAMPSPGS